MGAVKGAGIVVDTYGLVGLPIKKACGLVAVEVHVFGHEGLKVIEMVAKPLGISVHGLDDEGGMLGKRGLMHVGLPGVALLEHLLA